MVRQQAAGNRQPELALSEPAERDDPLNAVLDLVESTLRTALDLGLGPQIKFRLAGMPELAPDVPAEGPATGSRQQATGDDALLLANAVSLICEHGKRARTEPVRDRHAAVAAGLSGLMKNSCCPAKDTP